MVRAGSASLVFVTLCLAACGGESGGDAPGESSPAATPVALADLPSAMAKAQCRALAGCCQARSYPYDEGKCVAQATALNAAFAVTSTDRADYDPSQGGACVAALEAAWGQCKVPAAPLPACQTMFVPKVAEGGFCKSAPECIATGGGRAACVGSPGKCATVKKGSAGDACNADCTSVSGTTTCAVYLDLQGAGAAECHAEDALFCKLEGAACAPRAAVGAPCLSSNDCVLGAFCDGTSCKANVAVGGSCATGASCEGGYCDVAGGAVCKAPRAVGEPCPSGAECGPKGRCVTPSKGAAPTCAPSDDLATPALCGG